MFFKDSTPQVKKLIYRLVFLIDEIDLLRKEMHNSSFEYEEINTAIEVLRGQIENVKKELKHAED